MTEAAVEVIRRGIELFNRGEFERSLDILAPAGPELEWDTTAAVPDGGTYRGRAEVLGYWRNVFERWEGFHIEPEEWLTPDSETVVVLGRLIGRGAGSGVPVERPWDQVWRLREGIPIRCENYTDRGEAMRAAGIAEREGA